MKIGLDIMSGDNAPLSNINGAIKYVNNPLSKNNEIGIFLSKKYQGKNIGNEALAELIRKNPRKRYLANVNPKNKKSSKFFKNNDCSIYSFLLPNLFLSCMVSILDSINSMHKSLKSLFPIL